MIEDIFNIRGSLNAMVSHSSPAASLRTTYILNKVSKVNGNTFYFFTSLVIFSIISVDKC